MTNEEILRLQKKEQERKDDKVVSRIKDYIDEHGHATLSEMVKYIKCDYKILKRLIEEGRIEIVEDIDEDECRRLANEEKLKKLNAINELKDEMQRGRSSSSHGMYSKNE